MLSVISHDIIYMFEVWELMTTFYLRIGMVRPRIMLKDFLMEGKSDPY
jgi:hypothetical protein